MALYENIARASAPLLRATGLVVEGMGLALEGVTAYKEKRKRGSVRIWMLLIWFVVVVVGGGV